MPSCPVKRKKMGERGGVTHAHCIHTFFCSMNFSIHYYSALRNLDLCLGGTKKPPRRLWPFTQVHQLQLHCLGLLPSRDAPSSQDL